MTSGEPQEADGTQSDLICMAARTFREVGYVVLDDLYTVGWVEHLRAAYDGLVAQYLEDQGGLDALNGKTFGKNHIGIHPALVQPWADPQLIAHPKIDALLTSLLGVDYQCGYYHTNAALPGSGMQPIHRDVAPLFTGAELSVPHPVTNIVLNIPLCDFTEENGSTEVWPGTHLIIDQEPGDANAIVARAALLPSRRTNIPAGAAILRDLRMFHRGMPNDSSNVRAMLAIVYTRAFRASGTLDIPRPTWEQWPERARQIFRNNNVMLDDDTAPPYRLTKTAQG